LVRARRCRRAPRPPAVLVDDLDASADDARCSAPAGHAKVEVRLFNPPPVGGGTRAG
jgi:hypothetical protein